MGESDMTEKIASGAQPLLYKCEPVDWMGIPKSVRKALGITSMSAFAMCFYIGPLMGIFLIPYVWKVAPVTTGGLLLVIAITYVMPPKEWTSFRTVGQLWYELLDVSCSWSPDRCQQLVKDGRESQYILAMHPHGIVPFHSILFSAYCEQYLSDGDVSFRGFGAMADVVMYLPILRNILGWLSAGSCSYKSLIDGITKGKCPAVNANGRKPRHLFILPGGIAEIFTSTPGRNAIVVKKRYGLCRLSLETGAQLLPCYVFGGSDFFENLLTSDSWLSNFARKSRMGITIFWGQFGLPIPYTPKVSLCMAEPIKVKKWTGEGKIPQELIDELHAKYMASIQDLFDKYKKAAGHDSAVLEIE